MKAHWYIEATNYQNDFNAPQRIVYVLEELGHPVTTFQYVPFGGTDHSNMPTESPVVYYGTWNALADLRDRGVELPQPFAWCDWGAFRCGSYYAHYGDLVVQRDVRFLKLSQLVEAFGAHEALFVRPDDNEKSFVGQVVKRGMREGFVRDLLERERCSLDLDVLVAAPRRIEREWRVVMVDGAAVSASQYKDQGGIEVLPGAPDEVLRFAERAAKVWSPHPVFVLDIGLVGPGEHGIVEIGPFNYAGMYLNDVRAVVRAINEHVEKNTS